MGKRIWYICFGLAISLALNSCGDYAKIQKSTDFNKKLAYANQMFAEKKYSRAQTLYDQIKDVFKGTKDYESLFYKYAYTYYYLKDYESAAFYFKNYADIFPNSPHAIDMQFMQAYSYYKLSPRVELDQTYTEKAISAMQTFINTYPNSDKVNEANQIIDSCRAKLELKDYDAAKLYYNLGFYKAAGISFTNLLRDYPDSRDGDEYKYMAIKSYYNYANNSIPEKQNKRFGDVVTEYQEFVDHYPQSKYLKSAERYYTLSQNSIKELQHEQNKKEPRQ